MKSNFRAAMTWLHDGLGFVSGWVIFVIAFAGSLSVFRAEIGDWARPEASCCVSDTAASGAAAVRWLSAHAAGSPAWYISPADARATTSYVAWADGNGTFTQRWLDARTGSPDGIRSTLGGDFFYRLHFELQLPYPWGRIVAALAATILLLVLLTGIVAHRRFFTDFFTFRPGKGARSWLDAHNLLSVTALPFHLMIAFTGALTLANLVMPWGASSLFGGKAAAPATALFPAGISRLASGKKAPLTDVEPLLQTARRRFGGELFEVNVFNPGDAAALITIVRAEDRRIGAQAAMISFDGVTGRVLAAHEESRPAIAAYEFLYGLHTARFAQCALRWLYFLSGLALTGVISSGQLLWTAKRQQRRGHASVTLVQRLNIGIIGGAPVAFALFFLANRLLPASATDRAELEVEAVFYGWGVLLIVAALRSPAKAWRDMLALCSLACAAIPILDVALGCASWRAVSVGVDAVAAVLAFCFGLAAMRECRAPHHAAATEHSPIQRPA